MSQRTVYAIISLMTLTILGLVAVQWVLIRQSLTANEQQFEDVTHNALREAAIKQEQNEKSLINVGYNGFSRPQRGENELPSITQRNLENELEQDGPLSIPGQRLAVRPEDRFKSWPLSERIDLELLEQSLQTALEEGGIEVPFDYGIFEKKSDEFVIYNGRRPSETAQMAQLSASPFHIVLFDDRTGIGPGTLYLEFSGKDYHIWSSLYPILGLTALLLFVILGCFVYAIQTILRQKKLSAMKVDFINNMTHEFKTPIATISLAADSITNPKISGNPEKVAKFAGIIKQENKRMNNQVEKVLQMAKIDRKKVRLKISLVDINEVVESAATNISLQVEPKGGTVRTLLEADNAIVEGDQTHLVSVINNLLDNANKYTPEKPKIVVETKQHKNGVLVSVSDNGIGMNKETRKRIFDPFYRVFNGNRHDVKGFGLGLAYVKNIIEQHGGTIKVKSAPERGSKFTIFLPTRQAAT
ncbi:MAG: HAMP domain-containing sensor histidine kinase [Bacteroidota bacterium]